MELFNHIRAQIYAPYTFAELCHMAGISEADANLYGLNRTEVINLFFNQQTKSA